MLGDHLQDKMKLYGRPTCINTAKCLFTAAEKGIDIEALYIGDNGDGNAAEAAQISPYNSFPVLRDVDFVVYGTNAMMSYLDAKGFGPSLVPRNATVQTIMYKLIHISELATSDIASGDSAASSKWFDALETHLNNKDTALRGDYICGAFSLADCHWAALAQACENNGSGDILSSRSEVNKWWSLVKSHPSTSKEKIKAYDVLPTIADIESKTLRDIHINA